MRFWDSSAIVPLCINQPHTVLMRRLAREDGAIAAWWGTPLECYSAFARLRRENLLDDDGEAAARRLVTSLASGWTEVQPSARVREQAARLLLLHPLRAADSLQLAAASVVADGSAGSAFVCLDRRLREAARRESFVLLPGSL